MSNPVDKQLIFGIGLPKTGTSSLTNALYELGYTCLHDARFVKYTIAENRNAGRHMLYGLTDKYDAFCDSPIPWMFKDIDAEYPGSKFIYTVRAKAEWLVSRVAHFGGTYDTHARKYKEHMREVIEHFKDREDDILVYNLCAGLGWEPLCQFLNVDVPDVPFPHKNITTAARREKALRRLRR